MKELLDTIAMLNFSLNEGLAEKINLEIKKNAVPHSQLIVDSHNNGGLLLALSIAKELLGRDALKHPDFYFCFPIVKTDKKTLVSQDLMESFRLFFDSNPYCNVSDWIQSLDSSNKQGSISVEEIHQLHQKINLKAFEGMNKVCVIWAPELLNTSAANKMLKILEEPPSNTYFILISEKPEQVLTTIYSRSILLPLKRLTTKLIKERLEASDIDNSSEIASASQGSWRTAIKLSENSGLRKKLELLWINGLRSAFKSTGNKSIVVELMTWADNASKLSRDEQKTFLELGSNIIRSALVVNYSAHEASLYFSLNNFNIEKLAPFINSQNINNISCLFDEAYHQVKRNANSKILFSNFILKLAKCLNKKEA